MDRQDFTGLYESYLSVYDEDGYLYEDAEEIDEGRTEEIRSRMQARYGKPESGDTLRQHVSRKKYETAAAEHQRGWAPSPNTGKSGKLTKGQMMYKAHRSAEAMQGGQRLNASYDYDLYDLVLEYLLDEGLCESVENAEVMMAHMSEGWVDSIIDEAAKTVMSVTSPTGKQRRLNTTRATGPARNLTYDDRLVAFGDIERVRRNREGISFTPEAERNARQREQAIGARQRRESGQPLGYYQNRRNLVTMKRLQRKYGIPDSALDKQ